MITVEDLAIDPTHHTATRAGHRLDLTAKEFTLLHFMAQRQGEVLTRTVLAENVWDMNFDVRVQRHRRRRARLRRKVDDPFSRKLIHTVRGMGMSSKKVAESQDRQSIGGSLVAISTIAGGVMLAVAFGFLNHLVRANAQRVWTDLIISELVFIDGELRSAGEGEEAEEIGEIRDAISSENRTRTPRHDRPRDPRRGSAAVLHRWHEHPCRTGSPVSPRCVDNRRCSNGQLDRPRRSLLRADLDHGCDARPESSHPARLGRVEDARHPRCVP